MNKHCPYCGKELAEGASFCPYCTCSLIEKQNTSPPKLRKKKRLFLSGILLLGLICFISFFLQGKREELPQIPTQNEKTEVAQAIKIEEPSSEVGEAETYYTAENEKQYRVWINFSSDDDVDEKKYFKIPDGEERYGSFPTVLHISHNGDEMAWEEFMELVETLTLTAHPQDGAKMLNIEQPEQEPIQFSNAARKADISCSANNAGVHIVRWTLNMKNGDVITLEHIVEFALMEIKEYHWENYPMETVDELQSLLDQLEVTTTEDEVITIHLPPVTYEGGLELDGRSYIFYGSASESGRTTFTDTITASTNGPHKMEFHQISFEGEGGTGIDSQRNTFFYECEFRGWDIAVHAKDNGWTQSNGCSYFENKVALLFDCNAGGSFGPSFPENRFENNGIGLQIKATPNGRTLEFSNSIFTNNEVDIDNQVDHPLDLSRTVLGNNK
ncbi:MAG: zinc ribbon domain-containing protein [Oscillospiraceae bacterium]|nr:zinc ribbon domain-containing protein [Oscillospiraceae bacterium]